MGNQQRTPKQPIAIFAVLGFLNEYAGRYIARDSDHIETFSHIERAKAVLFEKYLRQLIDEFQLDTTIHRESRGDKSKESIFFYSKELARLINAYYLRNHLTGTEVDDSPAYTQGEGFFRKQAGLISEAVFPADDRESRLSYLIGAYQRFGQRNFFRFYNAGHKVKLVANLLKEAGSPNVVIIYPDPDAIPAVTLVAFEPTEELIERFGLQVDRFYFAGSE